MGHKITTCCDCRNFVITYDFPTKVLSKISIRKENLLIESNYNTNTTYVYSGEFYTKLLLKLNHAIDSNKILHDSFVKNIKNVIVFS
jgi:hypothetical protein